MEKYKTVLKSITIVVSGIILVPYIFFYGIDYYRIVIHHIKEKLNEE